jgi:recyclin-1
MFEINMDEYLDEEVEAVKLAFGVICKGWDRDVHIFLLLRVE